MHVGYGATKRTRPLAGLVNSQRLLFIGDVAAVSDVKGFLQLLDGPFGRGLFSLILHSQNEQASNEPLQLGAG